MYLLNNIWIMIQYGLGYMWFIRFGCGWIHKIFGYMMIHVVYNKLTIMDMLD